MATLPHCPRCGGTGVWMNPNDTSDHRTCFACKGAGRAAERTKRRQFNREFYRSSTPPADDPFVQLGDMTLQGATPPNVTNNIVDPTTLDLRQVSFQIATDLAPIIEGKIKSASVTLERDIKSWTRVELDNFATNLTKTILDEVAQRVPLQVELTRNGAKVPLPEGHQHPVFSTLLCLATSRDVRGFVPNIWISGPAGSGKTTGAFNLAKALQVPFFYNGALSTDFQVLGYKDAGGTYHTTAFREAVTQPSVYLFDDIDSCDSNAPLLALNGALANGLITFPDGQVERHPDCICIATANTWGLGATSDYVGRVKIDAAFLSRFPGRLDWGYDEAFEVAISGNPEWARRVQQARAKAKERGLKVVIDPRASIAGAAYIAAGFSPDETAGLTYLANLTPDQRQVLQ